MADLYSAGDQFELPQAFLTINNTNSSHPGILLGRELIVQLQPALSIGAAGRGMGVPISTAVGASWHSGRGPALENADGRLQTWIKKPVIRRMPAKSQGPPAFTLRRQISSVPQPTASRRLAGQSLLRPQPLASEGQFMVGSVACLGLGFRQTPRDSAFHLLGSLNRCRRQDIRHHQDEVV